MEDPSQSNDEGITALHNAVCAGHTEIVKFLVQFGVNVNAADSDGWSVPHAHRQAERQTDRLRERHTDRQADRQTDRQAERQTERQTG